MGRIKSCYDVVYPSIESSRAFATIGLLRLVTDATPADQVCTYIYQTGQPFGLRRKADSINRPNGWYTDHYVRHLNVHESKEQDRIPEFPSGIVKMSKEYLIQIFWKQIGHLRSLACMRDGCYRDKVRIFPNDVLKTLASLYIPATAKIYDVRNAIIALHSVATPIMLDKPNWLLDIEGSYEKRSDPSKFDTMKDIHRRNIAALQTVLSNYCYNATSQQEIPNDIEKNLLLDLIETFVVMFGPDTFANNFLNRQIYEYVRLNSTLSDRTGYRKYKFCERPDCCNRDWEDGKIQILENLKYLSPEAAICIGDMTTIFTAAGELNRSFLESIHPQPITEVGIYLKTELDVQKEKIAYTNKIHNALRNGEYDGEYSAAGCVDEAVPVPCECCA